MPTNIKLNKQKTTRPVESGDLTGTMPEFGRIRDIEHLFGLKRGSVYSLLSLRKIKGCVLRVRGNRSGVRLIQLDSVRDYIRSQMEGEQNA